MTLLVVVAAAFLLVLVLLALCSGNETGLYSLSRVRVAAEAEHGARAQRTVKKLLHEDEAVLSTLLLLNNALHQALAYLGPLLLAPIALPPRLNELVAALVFTPLIMFFGELLPKDLFRRRPHHLMPLFAQPLHGLVILLAPLTWPLRALSRGMTNALSLDEGELGRIHGREEVLELLRERQLPSMSRTESLARNALELRSLKVERVMVPWRKVEWLQLEAPPAAQRAQVALSGFSRLPAVDAAGKLAGYVHQLELLAADRARSARACLRPLPFLEPGTPLDRALETLRLSGQRLAVVGSPQRPLGLVALKDLLEEISGELQRW